MVYLITGDTSDECNKIIIDSRIEACKEELKNIVISNTCIDDMSGEELLEYYQSTFKKFYLENKIKQLEFEKSGGMLLIDYCFPPTTVEDAIKRREMDKKAAEFYVSYFKSE